GLQFAVLSIGIRCRGRVGGRDVRHEQPEAGDRPQVLHWDGHSWATVALPALPGRVNTDFGPAIVDISPTDAWLAGGWLTNSTVGSYIAHWNGTRWTLVHHPPVVTFSSLAADGPDDVWAAATGAGPAFKAVIEHYNGSAWTTSAQLARLGLAGITAVGPGEAWAVGWNGPQTAIVRWNGSAWKLVASPN